MNASPVRIEDDEAFPDVPAVEHGGTPDAKINYLSVSQLKSAAYWTPGGCLRKWWYKKIAGLEEPERASLQIGTEVHAQLEHYLKTGDDVLGDIARLALPYLPKPDRALYLEHPITASVRPISGALLEADGIPLVGFIDRIDPLLRPKVVDYKTSSNPEKYAAQPEDLTTTQTEAGIQMVGYAVAVSKKFPGAQCVDLEHIVIPTRPTKKSKAIQVGATIRVSDAREEWKRCDGLARELREVAKAPKVEDVPANYGACGAYGGCPFYGSCLVADSKANQPRKEEKMSLKELLAKRGQAPSSAASPAANGAANPAQVVEVPGAPVATGNDAVPVIVPPDAPKSDPKLAAEPLPEALDTRSFKDPAPVETASTVGHAAETPKPEPKKRGPKAKALTMKVEVDTAEAQAKIEALEALVKTASEDAAILVDGRNGFSLHIDCVPHVPGKSIATVDLASYVAARVAEIQAAFPDIIDIRNAPKKGKNAEGKDVDHPLAFGAWKGVLAAQCRMNPPKGTVVATGVYGSEFAQVAIEALEPLAQVVVKGVR